LLEIEIFRHGENLSSETAGDWRLEIEDWRQETGDWRLDFWGELEN
jgi:subtilisin-like proprotein convertase family protein